MAVRRARMLRNGGIIGRLKAVVRLADMPDITDEYWSLYCNIRTYTMTSPERVNALLEAVKYVARNEIPGGIAECGVWRGGSMMAAALTLLQLGVRNRHLYLFDTFEGMPKPSPSDVDLAGRPALSFFKKAQTSDDRSDYCRATLEEVQRNLASTRYPEDLVHFVRGKVEETIPKKAPDSLAILRLDTDWYESTKHELVHLYPRLSKGGILIVDDYGHWAGARRATEEYFRENEISIFLGRIDYTGRIGVKVD